MQGERSILKAAIQRSETDLTEAAPAPGPVELVELLFFAYRDFVGEPDRILAAYNFGRAHHRVLHFVNRHPGLSVAELLTILGITKQSLARVLRDLVEGGFIEQRPGTEDRRQRLLHLTATGATLAGDLLSMQRQRVVNALAAVKPADHAAIASFLVHLVDGEDRAAIARLVAQHDNGAAG